MKPFLLLSAFCMTVGGIASAQAEQPYFPDADEWQQAKPHTLGISDAAVEEAVNWGRSHDTPVIPLGADMGEVIKKANVDKEPNASLLGPTLKRGLTSGLIIKDGYRIGEWGDVNDPQMVFSVSKTFVSTMAGIAWRDGLIKDIHQPVVESLPELFSAPHNRPITWNQLLRQTSGWSGSLFGIPDWADRYKGKVPTLEERQPGKHWNYNDVRINLLSLSLLKTFKEPLPDVLRREVMGPIGASDSWSWNGYKTSWVNIDGTLMQSVSGGGHWGGGMFINTLDLARYGLLFLNEGRWKDKQILPKAWVEMTTEPTDVYPVYGFANWWLQRDKSLPRVLPHATDSSYIGYGAGGHHMLYIDPENDVIVVARWMNPAELDGVLERLYQGFES